MAAKLFLCAQGNEILDFHALLLFAIVVEYVMTNALNNLISLYNLYVVQIWKCRGQCYVKSKNTMQKTGVKSNIIITIVFNFYSYYYYICLKPFIVYFKHSFLLV